MKTTPFATARRQSSPLFGFCSRSTLAPLLLAAALVLLLVGLGALRGFSTFDTKNPAAGGTAHSVTQGDHR